MNPFKPEVYTTLQHLDGARRNVVISLAASLHQLGEIQRGRQQSNCLASYEESLALAEAVNDRAGAAACAFNLGTAYKDLTDIRDLARAEDRYRRCLELCEERDRLGQGKCLNSLGAVAYERFQESRQANKPEAELLVHRNAALQSYHQALDLLPTGAVDSVAVAHNSLGSIWGEAGHVDRALHHYRESIRFKEASSNRYAASLTRFNIATLCARANRLPDAREYARAALRGFETYGDSAAADIAKTKELLAVIAQAIQEQAT